MYTAADFELDERYVIKNEKLHWIDSEFDKTYFSFCYNFVKQRHIVEFYLYPTVGTVLIHSIKPELTE